MGVIVGLDVGGSTTKVVGFDQGKLLEVVRVKAGDPLTSAYGGFGKFLKLNDLHLTHIEKIFVTGVGGSYLEGDLLNCPTQIVPEFDSVGLGGTYLAQKDAAIVVSMGTGTSIVSVRGRQVKHVIGSGVGGGTLMGLSNKILNIHDFDTIANLSKDGDVSKVDLTIGDISINEIPGLPKNATASNFGKVNDLATESDLAMGIVNLVFQSVGTAAVLCARLEQQAAIIFTGNLIAVEPGTEILQGFSFLYQIPILVPEHAEYATAIGAALFGL